VLCCAVLCCAALQHAVLYTTSVQELLSITLLHLHFDSVVLDML